MTFLQKNNSITAAQRRRLFAKMKILLGKADNALRRCGLSRSIQEFIEA